MGKKACMVCVSKISKKYRILSDGKETLSLEFKPDYIIAVDAATTSLLGEELEEFYDKIDLSIDHHPTNTHYAKNTLLVPKSSSTGEIIHSLLKVMNVPITKTIANSLYCAIITDTGCFRYSNTTKNTFLTAAELFENGAETYELTKRMLDTTTKEAIELKKLAFERIKYYANGKIAVILITKEMLNKSNTTEDDIDSITIIPRTIEGVIVGLTIRPLNEGEFKISARSNSGADVSVICAKFGGGGHKKASACIIKGTIENAEENIVNAAIKYLEEKNI
jgi:phosphoesterase RecJ-like protein